MKFNSWYYNRNLKPQGPISTPEMREKIRSGEIGPHDLVCAQEDGRWMAAIEWGVFEQPLFPAAQEFILGRDIVPDAKEWVLLVHDVDKRLLQEGPFSIAELRSGLQLNKIRPDQFVWKAGLTGWSRIADRPEFKEAIN
ncbi:hypothetical protein AZI86_13550 [Bdellovibrio bacteriovorus]|uniref:GYF domain-containing protein n=1 Tax=Bdellovibrio bacteriovorus TaxID=959 RepID=A0A150WJ92_BDEBC|nr:DUF4339 domain-containing protein [Bdellovibrio bacteriovorus]KYG63838.1 hypothetical protein AZI86_13550 [Bdellovibrio bacteriovorus]